VVVASVPGAGATAQIQTVDARLGYRCDFPSGEESVSVGVSAKVPTEAATSQSVDLGEVSTSVEIPKEGVDELRSLGAALVTPSSSLTVDVSQGADRASTVWSGTGRPSPIPQAGILDIGASGSVAALSSGTPGDLVLTASDFNLDLALLTEKGTPTERPSLSVQCKLETTDPETARLATVHIIGDGAKPSDSPPSSPGSPSPTHPSETPTDRRDGLELTPSESTGKDESGPPCHKNPADPVPLVAYLTGFSNVSKLGGASLVPVSCVQIGQGPSKITPEPDGLHIIQHSTGRYFNNNAPQTIPGKSTFLTFGFTPTTATMVLEQTGPMTIDSDLRLAAGETQTDIRVPITLRLSDLRVNGVPLDVGPNCRTKSSLYSPDPDPSRDTKDHLSLRGTGKWVANGGIITGYNLTRGGPLTTTLTIPAFIGCGVTEDLDSLITASISGSHNYTKQIQGQTCAPDQIPRVPIECTEDGQPVVVPEPSR
jgi:hypothetical protein